ncbi:MAG: cytochrome C [Ignavibacteria bacterium]|nr:cytochrome C [Ignavibacteria bacterium]
MKIKYKYLILFVATIVFLFVTTKTQRAEYVKEEDRSKVIKFSHKFHADAGSTCEDCHKSQAESEKAVDNLLPKMSDCASCHDVNDEKECGKCHYENVLVGFENPVREIFFSHKFHLSDQKLQCESCHIGIEKVDYAQQAESPLPKMENCYSCHNDNLASNQCERCHANTNTLIPENHKVENFAKVHKHWVRTGMNNKECVMCHNANFCESCHNANPSITAKGKPDDFYLSTTPNDVSLNSKNQMKIQKVHELNYRFTHGIESKGKFADCESCHNRQTFCAGCHSAESEILMSKVKPQSHYSSDFMILGVGSGGGRHASLAKQDIERCVSCHDVNGNDPTCTFCHLDNDGIKGTNPKTHAINFMRNEEGDWHTDRGSICYNCHIDPNARPDGKRGISFCGYCHK